MKTNTKELVITEMTINKETGEIKYEANNGAERRKYVLTLLHDERGESRHKVIYDFSRKCFALGEYSLISESVYHQGKNAEVIDDRDENPVIVTFSDECIDRYIKAFKALFGKTYTDLAIQNMMRF